jgi:hypothetical protein
MDIRKITTHAHSQRNKPLLPGTGRTRIKDERLSATARRRPHLDRRMLGRHNSTMLPPGAPGIVGREAAAEPEG